MELSMSTELLKDKSTHNVGQIEVLKLEMAVVGTWAINHCNVKGFTIYLDFGTAILEDRTLGLFTISQIIIMQDDLSIWCLCLVPGAMQSFPTMNSVRL
jgi:hypothetical protein